MHGGSWEQFFLAWLTAGQSAGWNAIAGIFTFLGTESFFLILIPIVYWTVSRQLGLRLFYLLMATLVVNTVLKDLLAVPRPVGAEGVHSRDTASAMVDSHYPNDSFPSGHAQASSTLFGYMALVIRRRWAWWTAAGLVVLVALSRLYNGLHWPTDVLGGALIGAAVIAAAVPLMPLMERKPLLLQACAVLAFAVLTGLLVDGDIGMKLGGALLGGGLGHLLERRITGMEAGSGQWGRKTAAVLIGLIGMLALKAGVKAALPSAPGWELLRYALIGLWAFGAAPMLFVRLRLVPSAAMHSRKEAESAALSG